MDSKIYLSIKKEPTESSTDVTVENENVCKPLPFMVCDTDIKQEAIEETTTVECENIYDKMLTIKEEFCNTPFESTFDDKPNVPSHLYFMEKTFKEQTDQLGLKSNSLYTEPNYSHHIILSPALHSETGSSLPSLPVEVKSDDIKATIKESFENNLITNIPEKSKNNVKRKRASNKCSKNKVELDTKVINFTTNQYKIKCETNSVTKRDSELVTTEDNSSTNHNEIKSDTTSVTNNEKLNTPSLISIDIRPIINISDECTDKLTTEYTYKISNPNFQSEDIVKVNNECNTQLQCNNIENKCSCELCNIINKKSVTVDNCDNKGFVCRVCKNKFSLKVQLAKHMETHIEITDAKPYWCDICPYKTKHKSDIYTHIRIHGEKPYSCEICPFRTRQKYNLVRHIRIHTGESQVQCNICKCKCTEKTISDHMKTHADEKPFSCHACDFKCSNKQSLNVHLMNHREPKPYSCNLCEFRSAHKGQLTSHIRKHTGEKPYICNYCNFKSARKDQLSAHMRRHTGVKPYKCIVCGYRSARKGNLDKHMQRHTGVKPHTCNVCGFKSARKDNLDKHMQTHTGEKPYACNVCGLKSATKGNIDRHMKVHFK